jgi:hypothetical protein
MTRGGFNTGWYFISLVLMVLCGGILFLVLIMLCGNWGSNMILRGNLRKEECKIYDYEK